MADQQYDNNLRGYLFPYEGHDPSNEKSPFLKGKVTIEGVTYRLTAWKKEKGDQKFFSIAAQHPDDAPQQSAQPKQSAAQPF